MRSSVRNGLVLVKGWQAGQGNWDAAQTKVEGDVVTGIALTVTGDHGEGN